ncbi:MAG: putative phytochrome family protein [Verrucomicrobiaceae bacterium]|nr:putative phytochrome family protein [Verrucomicrobiaceae bacterium]
MAFSTGLKELIDGCALEPIHIPGKIQAHGFLLACDANFQIRYVSENVLDHINIEPSAALGESLFTLLAADQNKMPWLNLIDECNANTHFTQCKFKQSNTLFEVSAHWREGLLIAEFEPDFGLSAGLSATAQPLAINSFVTRLQQAHTVPAICTLAVEEMKRLTGFGRVLAYAFDENGHGNVIAEATEAGYESYLSLRFPASDIPPQARELYKLNSIRVIPDAHYQPVALFTSDEDRDRPLDLSLSNLRSVSPVHVQYMLNMGTLASMSISILVEGKLWGLISCHDLRPRYVSVSTRNTCELLGKILSLQVEAREGHANTLRRLELRSMVVSMLAAMADKDSVSAGLCAIPDTTLAFVQATGAAVVMAGKCHRIGAAPSEDALTALAVWLSENDKRDIFATDTLLADFPAVARLGVTVRGLLAVAISEIHPHYIMWFRPEVIKTVNWAGEPNKDRQFSNGVESLSPRKSFSTWQQILRDQSLPWAREEIDAATALQDSVRGIVLRKAEELANMADELRHANGELEAFSYSVSHDLRAPLRHIAGYAELLNEYEGDALSERAVHYLNNIGESVRFAGTLVDELLAFSQMGRSALRLGEVNVSDLIHHIKRELAPDFANREIEWIVHPLPRVTGDGAFLHLALRNLIANAIKYSRTKEHARIEIGYRQGIDEQIIYVRDNGVGFDMKYVGKLFGVFQRLHSMEEFEGTGIGLANVRRIVERHGGRVWAEGELERGATFYFALPTVIPIKRIAVARTAVS